MKFLFQILALIILGYLAQLFLSWWSGIVVAAIVGLSMEKSGLRAFLTGFLGIALLWAVFAFLANSQNEGILALRLEKLFNGMSPMSLILITALLGGLLGGMGSLSGNLGRKLFKPDIR